MQHRGGSRNMRNLSPFLLILLHLLLAPLVAGDGEYTDVKRYARYIMVEVDKAEVLEWSISGWTKDVSNGADESDKQSVFHFRVVDAIAERTTAATAFVAKHKIGSGMRCTDAQCVVRRLVSVMEKDENVRRKTLHTIGDSHSRARLSFWDNVKLPGTWSIEEHHYGAVTAYGYGRNPDRVRIDKRQHRLPSRTIYKGDALIFCFGEIDARVHIHRHSNGSFGAAQQMIPILVANYVAAIDVALSRLEEDEEPSAVLVLGVPPAVNVPDGTNVTVSCRSLVFAVDPLKCSETFRPFIGPPHARRSYVDLFNDALVAETSRRGFHFISLARYAEEHTGYLDPRYMNTRTPELIGRDNHVSSAEFVQGQLEEVLGWEAGVGIVQNEGISDDGPADGLRYSIGPSGEVRLLGRESRDMWKEPQRISEEEVVRAWKGDRIHEGKTDHQLSIDVDGRTVQIEWMSGSSAAPAFAFFDRLQLNDPAQQKALITAMRNAEYKDMWRKAAAIGDVEAQYNLAGAYESTATHTAAEWYRKAADQGHGPSQYSLGSMYEHGKGVKQSDTLAVEWYRKAADQGVALARHHLGLMYRNGRAGPVPHSDDALVSASGTARPTEDVSVLGPVLEHDNPQMPPRIHILHPNKNGGLTLRKAFGCDCAGGVDVITGEMEIGTDGCVITTTSDKYVCHGHGSRAPHHEVEAVLFLRNPLDRAISFLAYTGALGAFEIKTSVTTMDRSSMRLWLESKLKKLQNQNQSSYLVSADGKPLQNAFIGCVERMQHDWQVYLESHPDSSLPSVLEHYHKPIATASELGLRAPRFLDELNDFVGKNSQADFELWQKHCGGD